MALRQRIYYTDGTFHDGDISLSRTDNIQLIAEIRDDVTQYDPDTGIGKKAMHMGGDWFCFNGERWKSSHTKRQGETALEGKLMADDDFEALKKTAFKWLLRQ